MVNLKIIEQKLQSLSIQHKRYSHYIMASCMSGSHVDEHPSMMITESGKVYCKSCGFTSNVKELFDLDISVDSDNVINLKLSEPPHKHDHFMLEPIKEFDYPLPANFQLTEANEEKRGISIKTLRRYNVYFSGDWCVFPIEYDTPINRIKLGYAIRTNTGWVFSKKVPGSIHFSRLIYPLVNIEHTDTLFLVEGIFDALALIDKGFPAVAMYGGWVSNNYITLSRNLYAKYLHIMKYTPRNLVLFFDNDDAGRKYTESARKYFTKYFNVYDYSADTDPDEFLMQQDNINLLSNFVNEIKNRRKYG